MSSVSEYLSGVGKLIKKILDTQAENIQAAADIFAKSIAYNRAVYLLGPGHSAFPVLDIFPRYGSYIGFQPILDPRLMCNNIIGPGGGRELAWLEKEPGYIKNVLLSYHLTSKDSMLVFSHSGINAAPVEMALEAKSKGLKVVAVTSAANYKINTTKHSSGKLLHDIADIAIDNCSPAEDTLAKIDGIPGGIGAVTTITMCAIGQSLAVDTAEKLVKLGKTPKYVWWHPSVVVPGGNYDDSHVYDAYMEFVKNL